jgi:predicted DNA repair protein MutK
VGGAYLCFEGFEKLWHTWSHRKQEDKAHDEALMQALADPSVDLLALEKDKIKGAIRTDFILSGEIIAITLGTVQGQPWMTQFSVLASVALLMTVGVYGLVAGIVKIDDLGLYLTRLPSQQEKPGLLHALGRGLLVSAPVLMKVLSVVGTAAMFLVGGGILLHDQPFWVTLPAGVVAGAVVMGAVALFGLVRAKFK